MLDKIDSKILTPSFDPKMFSAARSGCGIIPRIFFCLLNMPAISLQEPFGLFLGDAIGWYFGGLTQPLSDDHF